MLNINWCGLFAEPIEQSHDHRSNSVRLETLRHHLSMVLPFYNFRLTGATKSPLKAFFVPVGL